MNKFKGLEEYKTGVWPPKHRKRASKSRAEGPADPISKIPSDISPLPPVTGETPFAPQSHPQQFIFEDERAPHALFWLDDKHGRDFEDWHGQIYRRYRGWGQCDPPSEQSPCISDTMAPLRGERDGHDATDDFCRMLGPRLASGATQPSPFSTLLLRARGSGVHRPPLLTPGNLGRGMAWEAGQPYLIEALFPCRLLPSLCGDLCDGLKCYGIAGFLLAIHHTTQPKDEKEVEEAKD